MKNVLKTILEIVNGIKYQLLLLILLLTGITYGCQDKEATLDMLKNHNYEVVEIGGFGWYDCPQNTWWRTKFVVKDKSGKEVHGCYCVGFEKKIVINE